MSTIFTKIINREIPASIVYEDESHIAFLDISPFTKGHTLIVPKKEYSRFTHMPENEYCELQRVVQKLSKHYREIFNSNIGSVIYGEDVPHVHIHIFPITTDIEVFNFSKTKSYGDGEMEEFKNKLMLK
ncbi:MAG: HIT domain-containing protein [Nanoarchaeota archaeon]|nr:HIT domain-containing protein [Nanoarchaeota archaeon]